MKVRLWRGPFNGKVIEHRPDPVIQMTGPKKLTREQKYKLFRESQTYPYHNLTPRIVADYQMVMRPVTFEHRGEIIYQPMPVVHPDGSYFYEHIKGSTQEW